LGERQQGPAVTVPRGKRFHCGNSNRVKLGVKTVARTIRTGGQRDSTKGSGVSETNKGYLYLLIQRKNSQEETIETQNQI